MSGLPTEEWLQQYRGLVEADGRNYPTVKAEGNDSTIWGTWPTSTNGEVIDRYLGALGQDLPTGHHAFKLVVLDSTGKQVAALPRTVHGSSREAKQAQQTSLDQAKAHSILATATESAVNSAIAQRDILEKKYFESIEHVGTLVETCIDLARRAELREAEQEARIAHHMAMTALAEKAGPLFELAAYIGKKKFDQMWEEQQKKGAASASQPPPTEPETPSSRRRSASR